MDRGFYLISSTKNDEEQLKNKKHEMKIFERLNNVEMELVFFEDIIPIAETEFDGKIQLIDGEIDCPDFVFIRAFDLGEKQYHLNAVLHMFKKN